MPKMIGAYTVVDEERDTDDKAAKNQKKNDAVSLLLANIVRAIVCGSCHKECPPVYKIGQTCPPI